MICTDDFCKLPDDRWENRVVDPPSLMCKLLQMRPKEKRQIEAVLCRKVSVETQIDAVRGRDRIRVRPPDDLD